MPKDTRIDDLITHFEGERANYQAEIHRLDLERYRNQAFFEAAGLALKVLRNGNGQDPARPVEIPDTPDKPRATRTRKDPTVLGAIKARVESSLYEWPIGDEWHKDVTHWQPLPSAPEAQEIEHG